MNRLLLVLALSFCIKFVFAYEVDTHALITARAMDRSILLSSALAERMGWDRYDDSKIFGVPNGISFTESQRGAYFDALPDNWASDSLTGIVKRIPTVYERRNMPPDTFDGVVYRQIGNTDMTINEQRLRAWLMRGSIREDDLLQTSYKKENDPEPPDIDPHGEFMRVYHHFYDPVHQNPLTMPGGLPCTSLLLPGLIAGGCALAIDWALGQQDALDAASQAEDSGRRNHFSWADARAAQWCALTAKQDDLPWSEYSALRRLCWATSLKSLGATLHLLQDMAQPQHVRNDRHNPPIDAWYSLFVQTDAERRSYEIYTNWRATAGLDTGAPKEEKEQFLDLFGRGTVPPPIANTVYPIPRLELPIEYYTTRHVEAGDIQARRGMADFTNRNFFSEGTILSSDYPQPPADLSDAGYQINESEEQVAGLGPVTRLEITRMANDSLNPGFADPVLAPFSGQVPLATKSLWCNDEGVENGFCGSTATISLDQYRVQADVLIPRAVAYSAGLIDYFFRGRLQVDAPADGGLLAALDQGIPHSVDGLGYPHRTDNGDVFGFTKIRLGVRNTTQLDPSNGDAATDQPIGAGELVAVARYHRNPCYQPDLRSEWVHSNDSGQNLIPSGACTLDQLRTAYEEISVSAPILSPPDLNGGSLETVVFDFAEDPIPLNVTDLYFQVAFRGELGTEKDGIAVGRWEAPEPIYLTFHNATDIHVSEESYQASTPPPADGLDRTDNQTIAAAIWNTTQPIFHISGILPVKRFVRVGVIGPKTAGRMDLAQNLQFGPFIDPGYYFPSIVLNSPRQATKETIAAGVYNPTQLYSRRGITLNLWVPTFKDDGIGLLPSYSLLPPLSPAEQIAMPGIVVIDSDL